MKNNSSICGNPQNILLKIGVKTATLIPLIGPNNNPAIITGICIGNIIPYIL